MTLRLYSVQVPLMTHEVWMMSGWPKDKKKQSPNVQKQTNFQSNVCLNSWFWNFGITLSYTGGRLHLLSH